MRRKIFRAESTARAISPPGDADKDRHDQQESFDRRGDIDVESGEHDVRSHRVNASDSEKKPKWSARVVTNTLLACALGLFAGFCAGDQYYGHKRREANEKNPIPDRWETFSYTEIYEHYGCSAHAHDQSKPLHTPETWKLFREKYNENVNADFEFNDPVPPTEGYSMDGASRQPPPFVANFSPGKGRGVFATRDINTGELVHNGERSAVPFDDAAAWRRFVFSLPRNMACDVAEWSWTQTLSTRGRLRVLVDLNISAFFNSGWSERSNVGPKEDTSLKFYATEDIPKGAELLYNYDVYSTDWHGVGL